MRRLLNHLPKVTDVLAWLQPFLRNNLAFAFRRLILPFVLWVLVTQLVATPAGATSIYEVPSLTADSWVIDQGEVLSRLTEGKISSALSGLAKDTGYEVRMVSIHRLDYDETAQSFTDKLFERWFKTPEEQANQVLLVIDDVTNDIGIRTGETVKQLMPDAIATSVAQESVLFPLKEGNKYNQAFFEASDRMVAVLSGQADPGPPELRQTVNAERNFATREETKSSNATAWVVGLLLAATVIPMATYYFYQWLGTR